MKKKTICLNMIVRNEKDAIERCLTSALPLIDYYVIVDTGSTDGTQEIIKKILEKVPGELYERPWKDFEHNRNEALELAKGKADYILIIDADDKIVLDQGFKLPENLNADFYHVRLNLGGTSYTRPQLIKSSLPWEWVGVLHEVLVCHQARASEIMPGMRYVCGRDGARSKDPEKYLKDALVLEEALKNEPENNRYVFYLAQSYNDAKLADKALNWYGKRITLGGREEEIFWSLLQIAILQKRIGMPLETVLNSYQKAHQHSPHRVEPLYYIAEIYNQEGRFDLAIATINKCDLTKNDDDLLFNQAWIHEYGLDFQLALATFQTGRKSECLKCCDRILKSENLNPEFREMTKEISEFLLST